MNRILKLQQTLRKLMRSLRKSTDSLGSDQQSQLLQSSSLLSGTNSLNSGAASLETQPDVTLIRDITGDDGTFGQLFISGKAFCFTAELPWNENIQQFSCIPTGKYTCTFSHSPKRGYKVYWVLGVPNRSAVQIHAGNYAGDTRQGYRSHVYGCILLGGKRGKLDGQTAVLMSKTTVRRFAERMKEANFELNIVEKY